MRQVATVVASIAAARHRRCPPRRLRCLRPAHAGALLQLLRSRAPRCGARLHPCSLRWRRFGPVTSPARRGLRQLLRFRAPRCGARLHLCSLRRRRLGCCLVRSSRAVRGSKLQAVAMLAKTPQPLARKTRQPLVCNKTRQPRARSTRQPFGSRREHRPSQWQGGGRRATRAPLTQWKAKSTTARGKTSAITAGPRKARR